MTLSNPVKIAALAGLVLILGAAGMLLLFASRPHAKAAQAPVTPQVTVAVSHVPLPARHVKPARPKVQLDPALPAAVRQKLALSREVVALVYTGASAADRSFAVEARAGAHTAHVPFVGLDVTDEHVADTVFSWAGSTADPLLLVVRRPGRIVFSNPGPTDRHIVAQAAVNAK